MNEIYRKLIRGEELNLEEAEIIGHTYSIHSEFPIRYGINGQNYIGSTKYQQLKNISLILKPHDYLVAKFFSANHIQREYENLQKAKEKGISVINPIQLANVYISPQKRFQPALVLERFNGKTIYELQKSKSVYLEEAYELWKQELKKASDADIIVNDRHNENVMFDAQTKKIVLLDAVSWIVN